MAVGGLAAIAVCGVAVRQSFEAHTLPHAAPSTSNILVTQTDRVLTPATRVEHIAQPATHHETANTSTSQQTAAVGEPAPVATRTQAVMQAATTRQVPQVTGTSSQVITGIMTTLSGARVPAPLPKL